MRSVPLRRRSSSPHPSLRHGWGARARSAGFFCLAALSVAAVLCGLTPRSVVGGEPGPVAKQQPPKLDDTVPPDKKEEPRDKKPEVKPDRFFAITHAQIHTVTNGDLLGATVLAKNGRIYRIGTQVDLPADTEVLDAQGLHVYPGFVAAATGNVLGDGRPDDTTDVYSLFTTMALAGGITTMMADNAAAKLTFGSVDGLVVKLYLFKSLKYSSEDPEGRRKVREGLEKVRQYLRDLQAHEEQKKTDPKAKEPDKEWLKGEYEAYLKLLKRETAAEVTANTAHELLDICELARQFDIRVVVRGAYEGWTVGPQMARAGLSAIVTPRRREDPDERLNRPTGASIENAAILYNHGVRLAIVPGISSITTWGVAGRDLLQLNMEAAFAVRGGLPADAALRAITIDAARVLGIDDRVGSIEVGKDADFIVVDGDPLHYMTLVRWTVVNGRVVYDKAKESLYAHIRPDGKLDAPPPDEYWPRRLGE